MKFDNLPVLGVGASLSLASRPDPVALASEAGGPAFIEYAGLADVYAVIEQVNRVREAGIPVLFHPSYINFCGSFANNADWLDTTAEHISRVESAWFAQDCAYCFWDNGHGYSTSLGYFVPPILNQASLQTAIERVKEVQARVPVTVAIEPPPVTFVIGDMPVFEFFGRLAEACDCALLLDMGHLVSYEMATQKPLIEDIDQLPAERVIEVHIAGGRLKQTRERSLYVDAHECEILDETWQMFAQMLPYLSNVKAVCYECEGVEAGTVLRILDRIRQQLGSVDHCAHLSEVRA